MLLPILMRSLLTLVFPLLSTFDKAMELNMAPRMPSDQQQRRALSHSSSIWFHLGH